MQNNQYTQIRVPLRVSKALNEGRPSDISDAFRPFGELGGDSVIAFVEMGDTVAEELVSKVDIVPELD